MLADKGMKPRQHVAADFWKWPNPEVPGCPLSRRYQGHSGRQTASPIYEYTPWSAVFVLIQRGPGQRFRELENWGEEMVSVILGSPNSSALGVRGGTRKWEK